MQSIWSEHDLDEFLVKHQVNGTLVAIQPGERIAALIEQGKLKSTYVREKQHYFRLTGKGWLVVKNFKGR